MKKTIIAISLLTTMTAQAADVFRYGTGGMGYDPAVDANINYRQQQVEMYNYNTGLSQDVDISPSYGGGYSGSDINMETGRMFDVDVDKYGNVEIWNY